MLATKPTPFISPPLRDAVPTGVDTASPVTRDYGREDSSREAWQHLIDYRLIEWGRDPTPLEDVGVEPPSGEVVRLAVELAQAFRDAHFPPPNNVVPDPNGGIVFERRETDVSEAYHVWDDGTVEYQRFHGTRLVERRTL
jgi:hypothetical protein